MPRRASDLWLFLLAAVAASLLWLFAHSSATMERGYDIPVAFDEVPERLVITERSADAVNIQVRGTRAAHRAFSSVKSDYRIDASGAKTGPSLYEVETSRIELPSGAQITSRSPASIEVTYERRGRKSVKIRPDLEGDVAEGFLIKEVSVEPPRVWLVGARSSVLRLSEVVTETIDVSGLEQSVEREARLSLGAGHVWMEESQPVTVRIEVESELPPEDEGEPESVG